MTPQQLVQVSHNESFIFRWKCVYTDINNTNTALVQS